MKLPEINPFRPVDYLQIQFSVNGLDQTESCLRTRDMCQDSTETLASANYDIKWHKIRGPS